MSGNGTRIQLSDDWTDGGWFSFPRRFVRDRGLSWKAKGIAALLASHSATFVFSATELEKWARDGRDGTAAGIRELESAGYLRRERQSSGEMVYRLFPEPQTEKPEEAGGKPLPENPPTENPVTEKPGVYKETTPKETTKGLEDARADISAHSGSLEELDLGLIPATGYADVMDAPSTTPVDDRLEELWREFWEAYPLKKAKQGARKSWDSQVRRVAVKARVERAEAIVAGARTYAKQREAEEPDKYRRLKFTKQPTTWLNQGCWEDEVLPVGSGHPRGGYQPYRDQDYYPNADPYFVPERDL